MANFYEHFSDQLFAELTDEEKAWIEDFLTPFDPYDGTIERGGETLLLVDEDGEWTPIGERWKKERGSAIEEDDGWPRFDWEIDKDGVWLHDDGGCFNAVHVCEFVHAFIKEFRPKLVWKMTWAGVCEKPQLGSFGGGWAVVDVNGVTFGTVGAEADAEVEHLQDPWSDDLVQFARLIDEIRATQDISAWTDLCASMDLEPERVDELFDRAHKVWEKAKAER